MGLVPKTAVLPPHGAIASGVLANRSATSPALGEPLHVKAGGATMVRARHRRGGQALRPGDGRQFGDGEVEGGIGEAVRCVDREHAGTRAGGHRDGAAVDLPGLEHGEIGRDAPEPVALQAVGLRRHEVARHAGCGGIRRAVLRKDAGGPGLDPREGEAFGMAQDLAHHREPGLLHSRSTFAAVTADTRTLLSPVTPAMCGREDEIRAAPEHGRGFGVQRLVLEHVERRAAELPASSAAARAAWSTTPPRAALIRIAPARIEASARGVDHLRVPGVSGTCRLTTSDIGEQSAKPTQPTPCSSQAGSSAGTNGSKATQRMPSAGARRAVSRAMEPKPTSPKRPARDLAADTRALRGHAGQHGGGGG